MFKLIRTNNLLRRSFPENKAHVRQNLKKCCLDYMGGIEKFLYFSGLLTDRSVRYVYPPKP